MKRSDFTCKRWGNNVLNFHLILKKTIPAYTNNANVKSLGKSGVLNVSPVDLTIDDLGLKLALFTRRSQTNVKKTIFCFLLTRFDYNVFSMKSSRI